MLFDPPLENIATLLTPLPVTWGFCGGWSIDLFLNRITRSHKDVDVAILRREQQIVFAALRQQGWILEQAINGTLQPFEDNEFLMLPVHEIWCKHASFYPDFLELLLNESEGDRFLFRRNRSIQCQLSEAFVISPSGLPVLAPQIALLYKSNDLPVTGNQLDFYVALPYLSVRQKQWLTHALSILSPEHEWLTLLADS
jgi:Aminoglycoside-2''-adenylyltransferase